MAPPDQPDEPWCDFPTTPLPHLVTHQTPSEPEQTTLHEPTSSKTGSFYFAFGSNLSPSQMALRLNHSPSSSVPIAIARLDAYRWIICRRGYANVVKLPASTPASHATTVWGVLYSLDAADEATLDRYEGHDEARNPDPEVNPDPKTRAEKPYEQGNWDYNKHYLPVRVAKWLVDPSQFGVEARDWKDGLEEEEEAPNGVCASLNFGDSQTPGTTVRVLVYVDEWRTEPGQINFEYIGRMNRAIDESTELGYPKEWVDAVMRKFIVPGIGVKENGYVGTDQGYVEAEATEAYDETTENAVRAWREEQRQQQEVPWPS